MEKQKQELIKYIKNIRNEEYINTLYEIIVNKDVDYIENLFPTKADFDEFIDHYRVYCDCMSDDLGE